MKYQSPGARMRIALTQENPLQIIGTLNAYSALLAEEAGFSCLYLSGAGVANSSYGLPDLGMTNLNDVLIDVRRITNTTALPLLVDVDTGWGSAFNIARTTREMIQAGAAGMHIEDQVQAKRCGHRPGKAIVSENEMVDRIKAAVDGRTDPDFVIMARTDALAQEGINAVIDRASRCLEAGADMIFPEAVTSLEDYQKLSEAISAPLLANITEFGNTPLFTVEELAGVGVKLILYPLSAFRAMSLAAKTVFDTIRKEGTQKNSIDKMQTREELYDVLNYHDYEKKLDKLFKFENGDGNDE